MPAIPTSLLEQTSLTTGVVTSEILINGEVLPSTVQVYAVDIWNELNRITRARLSVLDGDASEETFSVSEDDWFVPGNEIEIQLGYQSENTAIFKGMVLGQSIKVRSNGNSMLTVECADFAIKMTTAPKSRYFYEKKESEIFEDIISEYSGLSADVEPTEFTHTELLQFESTDWDFIMSRVEINGLFCTLDGGTVSIGKPDFGQEPVEVISYGHNLREIDAEIEAGNQVGSVKGIAWDYSRTEPAEVDASSQSPASPGNFDSASLADSLETSEWSLRAGSKIPTEVLQKWADAKLMKHELAKVRGRAKVRGLSTIIPGSVITLAGVGDRFNGNAFVSGIKHSFFKGEWVMDVQFGLSPKWFSERYKISSMPAAGMLPSVSGLQIGLVTQIQEDPDGDERLLVRLPMIDASEQGVWARLATSGAGNNRGVLIRPEIEDEVVVGFIHGDPNQPIILGSLHSANNPAPIAPSDDNNEKGWVTRSEVKMLLDEEKPSIVIEMPSGKKIVVDDDAGEILLEDENGNKVVLSSDGINMESPADINIKATGDLNLEGLNINAKAGVGFKAEGSASAEISSSGSTTVKGSIVQIN